MHLLYPPWWMNQAGPHRRKICRERANWAGRRESRRWRLRFSSRHSARKWRLEILGNQNCRLKNPGRHLACAFWWVENCRRQSFDGWNFGSRRQKRGFLSSVLRFPSYRKRQVFITMFLQVTGYHARITRNCIRSDSCHSCFRAFSDTKRFFWPNFHAVPQASLVPIFCMKFCMFNSMRMRCLAWGFLPSAHFSLKIARCPFLGKISQSPHCVALRCSQDTLPHTIGKWAATDSDWYCRSSSALWSINTRGTNIR